MSYYSKYYQKELTLRQHIIEIILERQSQAKGKDLPNRYCDLKKWANEFKRQSGLLTKLSKDVLMSNISLCLKQKEFQGVYSLANPYFISGAKAFQKKSKIEVEIILEPSGTLSTNSKGNFKKKQTKLDALDE